MIDVKLILGKIPHSALNLFTSPIYKYNILNYYISVILHTLG